MRWRISEPAPSVAINGLHRNAEHDGPGANPARKRPRVEVRILQAVLEFPPTRRLAQGNFDQRLIEPMPRDGVDDFARPPAVGLQCTGSIALVNESSAHRYQRVLDLVEHAGQFERMDPAIGQRQIDGSARLAGVPSRVVPTLVERHSRTAARRRIASSAPVGPAPTMGTDAPAKFTARPRARALRPPQRRRRRNCRAERARGAEYRARASRRSLRRRPGVPGSALPRGSVARAAGSIDSRAALRRGGDDFNHSGSRTSIKRCRKPVRDIDFSRSLAMPAR